MPEDVIAEAEEAELDAHRSARAANLFDVRRFIGGLFAIYGVILTVLGIGASDADIEQGGRDQREPLDRAGDARRRRAVPRLGVHAAARRASSRRPSQSRRAAGPGATATAPAGGAAAGREQG